MVQAFGTWGDNPPAKTARVLAPSFYSPTPAPPLTDIKQIDPSTDQEAWLERLCALRDKRHVTAMHLHDIHAPFHDVAALALAYQLVERSKPDVIVVGSDQADFALLSSFSTDPDLAATAEDELHDFRNFHHAHIAELKRRAPDAALVWIYGNHEARIVRHVGQQAPGLRRFILDGFTSIIRAGGDVYYLGEVDHVRLAPLCIMHGRRIGEGAAKAHLKMVNHQMWVQFGHTHKRLSYTPPGGDYPVGAEGAGCLCSLQPHYERGYAVGIDWQQGTSVMDIDLQGRDVDITNLLFQRDGERIWTRFERSPIEEQLSRAA